MRPEVTLFTVTNISLGSISAGTVHFDFGKIVCVVNFDTKAVHDNVAASNVQRFVMTFDAVI